MDYLLGDTITSLHDAGWPEVTVFAEPNFLPAFPNWDNPKYLARGNADLRVNSEKLGAWRNWRQGLETLFRDSPDADFYAMAQDDILLWQGARNLCEETLSPDSCALYSLYTSDIQFSDTAHGEAPPNRRGWYKDTRGWFAVGALFTVVPRALVDRIRRHLPMEVPENKHIDAHLGKFSNDHEGVESFRFNPSLIHHTGHSLSTLGYPSGAPGRQAANFIGERSP